MHAMFQYYKIVIGPTETLLIHTVQLFYDKGRLKLIKM